MKHASSLTLIGVLTATLSVAAHIEEVTYLPNDHPAIQYVQQAPDDPVARLGKRIESGDVKLDYSPEFGYLPALLKQFGLNIDSLGIPPLQSGNGKAVTQVVQARGRPRSSST